MSTTNLSTIRNPLYKSTPFNKNTKRFSKYDKIHRVNFTSAALRRSNSYGSQSEGRIVDENMLVLRKRIHEMKMVERNYEPPKEWMEWEKQIYTQYDEYIVMVLGLIQAQLMETRPSVALGALALLTLCVPTSLIFLANHIAQTTNTIFKL
ncbi:unnamed protein product [Amaranthus hypochondriacus]